MNLLVAVAPAYVALSYALIGFAGHKLPVDPMYMIFGEKGALWQEPGYFRSTVIVLPILAGVTTAVFDFLFRREGARTFGMIMAAVILIGFGFWEGFQWNSRALLSVAWPGMLAVVLMWVKDVDLSYRSGQTWKWELFFACLFTLATIAFIPYALALGVPREPDAYRFMLATVVTHGVGLLLCILVFLQRLSPKESRAGLMKIMGLCARVITTMFKSSRLHGDISMTIATVSNSLSDLLAEMMVGTRRTIMYTDIRSSTEMVERLGTIDSYRLFMKSWNMSCAILRVWNGTTPKDLGDGLISTFKSPVDAIKAAGSILEAHNKHNAGAGADEEIQLKIGLHTGNVLLHYGWDPRGHDSHLAQRVVSNAEPGTILVTRATWEEAAACGVELQGEWRHQVNLKGISEPVDLFVVPIETIHLLG